MPRKNDVSEMDEARQKLQEIKETYEWGTKAQMDLITNLMVEIRRLKIAGTTLAHAVEDLVEPEGEAAEAIRAWFDVTEGGANADERSRV